MVPVAESSAIVLLVIDKDCGPSSEGESEDATTVVLMPNSEVGSAAIAVTESPAATGFCRELSGRMNRKRLVVSVPTLLLPVVEAS